MDQSVDSRADILARIRAYRAGALRPDELSDLMARLDWIFASEDAPRDPTVSWFEVPGTRGVMAAPLVIVAEPDWHASVQGPVDYRRLGFGDALRKFANDSNAGLIPPNERIPRFEALADLNREDAAWFGHTATDLRANVHAFHVAVGQAEADRPMVPSETTVRLRARLIAEECVETLYAMFATETRDLLADEWLAIKRMLQHVVDRAPVCMDLVEVAETIGDLMYVCEGAFLVFGIDSRPVHAEVQRSNMAKAGGPQRADGKIMKPAGWTPPDIAGVIARQIAAADTRGNCAFCGRKPEFMRGIQCAGKVVSVCVDPVRDGDKPMPPNCAWRYCARVTDGRHNPGDNGDCKTCGKPANVGK